jgi:predicted tellurium resistance membrane protein TerC
MGYTAIISIIIDMKPRTFIILIGIFLFAFGTILSLYFSSNLLWGEMEALLFAPQTDARSLDLSCPLMIAPNETATISTTITNTTDDEKKPQVNAFFSYQRDMQVDTQTLLLDSYSSQPLQWTIDSSNMVFDRLILVSILQRQYRNLEAHQSQCSIYVFSLFGLNGQNSLMTVFAIGMITSLLGLGMMYQSLKPFSEKNKRMMQVNLLFLILIVLGVFSSFPRLWGLTLFFNATAVLSITVAYVEILLSKK